MTNDKMTLRNKLVDIALDWQENFGVAPSITSAISEYDAAMLIGMPESDYSDYMQDKTAVSKGADFIYKNTRYQVKANRPSGKKGSFVTMVPMIRVLCRPFQGYALSYYRDQRRITMRIKNVIVILSFCHE